MTSFTWKNTIADVYTSSHGRTVQTYLSDVIEPSIQTLENKIADHAKSHEGWAAFAERDAIDLLHETKMAFCLAVQSLWERQLRVYLFASATELGAGEDLVLEAQHSHWARIEKLFYKLRGIRIREFPSYRTLYALHLLGNVCRHGDGPSVEKLRKARPDFWPKNDDSKLYESVSDGPLPSLHIVISIDQLREFIEAISTFWDDAKFIYLESIENKHQSAIKELETMRSNRTWFPKMDGQSDR